MCGCNFKWSGFTLVCQGMERGTRWDTQVAKCLASTRDHQVPGLMYRTASDAVLQFAGDVVQQSLLWPVQALQGQSLGSQSGHYKPEKALGGRV